MSKITISELEAYTANTDLALAPNGTGSVEISNDEGAGVLQLNSSPLASSKVKLKSPPESAAQNYTLILPDNQIAQDKFLQVKSITGSGSTATGQLEYATVSPPSLNLDAANIDSTSGTVPVAQLPSPLPATSGLGYKLVSNTVVPSGGVGSISLTGLEDDSIYRIKCDKFYFNGYNNDWLHMRFLNSSNTEISGYKYDYVQYFSYWTNPSYYNNQQGDDKIRLNFQGNGSYHSMGFIMDLSTKEGTDHLYIEAFRPYSGSATRNYTIGSLRGDTRGRIYGIKFYSYYGYNIEAGSELQLYKYQEA